MAVKPSPLFTQYLTMEKSEQIRLALMNINCDTKTIIRRKFSQIDTLKKSKKKHANQPVQCRQIPLVILFFRDLHKSCGFFFERKIQMRDEHDVYTR